MYSVPRTLYPFICAEVWSGSLVIETNNRRAPWRKLPSILAPTGCRDRRPVIFVNRSFLLRPHEGVHAVPDSDSPGEPDLRRCGSAAVAVRHSSTATGHEYGPRAWQSVSPSTSTSCTVSSDGYLAGLQGFPQNPSRRALARLCPPSAYFPTLLKREAPKKAANACLERRLTVLRTAQLSAF